MLLELGLRPDKITVEVTEIAPESEVEAAFDHPLQLPVLPRRVVERRLANGTVIGWQPCVAGFAGVV